MIVANNNKTVRGVILKKENLLRATVFLMAFFWTFCTSKILVEGWGWRIDGLYPLPMSLAQLISVPLLSSAFFLFRKLLLSDLWLRWIGWGYFFIFLAIGLLLAPGCLVEDSFYTFHMVRMGWWSAWYSVLHPMLITALLQILPWEFWGPSILLALAWAAFFTFLHHCLYLLKSKAILHAFVMLIAVSPLAISAGAIVIRDSYFTLAFLGFILLCFRLLIEDRKISYFDLLLAGFVGGLVAAYRVDSLPSVMILLIGVCAFLKKAGKICILRYSLMAAILPVLFWLSVADIAPRMFADKSIVGNSWDNRAAAEYQLTLIENPLGYIVKSETKKISSHEKEILEKVFLFSDLKNFHCPENICVFYGGHWNKSATKTERTEAFMVAMRVFLKNPILFLGSKIETLKAVGKKSSQTSCSFESRGIKYNFLVDNEYLGTWRSKLNDYFTSIESQSNYAGILHAVIFSAIVCLFVIFRWRMAPAAAFLAFILLTRSLAVLLTAPAGFVMYYFSLLIGVPVMGVLWLAEVRFRTHVNRVASNMI